MSSRISRTCFWHNTFLGVVFLTEKSSQIAQIAAKTKMYFAIKSKTCRFFQQRAAEKHHQIK